MRRGLVPAGCRGRYEGIPVEQARCGLRGETGVSLQEGQGGRMGKVRGGNVVCGEEADKQDGVAVGGSGLMGLGSAFVFRGREGVESWGLRETGLRFDEGFTLLFWGEGMIDVGFGLCVSNSTTDETRALFSVCDERGGGFNGPRGLPAWWLRL